MQPGGQELILEHAGKDVTRIFQNLHPRGTLEHALTPENRIGEVDPAYPATEAVSGDEEEERDERRAELPPLSSVVNIASFEAMAKEVLGEDSRSWLYISGYSDDGVCKLAAFLPETLLTCEFY